MPKIRRDDMVYIISGKDRGKSGKVLKVFSKEGRIIIEGLNLVKKHMRRTKEDQQGGIVSKESPIHISNVMPYCQKCSRPTRPKVSRLGDGSSTRLCSKCGAAL